MKKKLKNLIPSKRRLMQLYLGLLLNANLKGFISGRIYTGKTKIVCAPGINCYSCPGAVGACPLGSLQGSFSKNHSAVFYVCGILLLYAIMFGRMICGWICPFGLVQDLLHKVPSPKVKKSPVTRALSLLKYAILVLFVFVVPIAYGLRHEALPAFCKYICPAGTLEGGMTLTSNWFVQHSYLWMLGPLFTWKFLLMVSILVGCIFIFRLFCRFICPLGALYGLFNKFSVFGIKVDDHKCTNCGLCTAHCKVDIKTVGDRECISCGDCISVCPSKAISFKGIKFAEPSPKTKKKQLVVKIVAAVLMLALLGGAIYYFWQDTPPMSQYEEIGQVGLRKPVEPQQELTEGNQVGNLCYSFEAETVTADGVSGETIDPTKTGKVTVINFWGTWCGPCVAELPYFDKLAKEHDVTVIAIHSALSRDTAPDFIKTNYPDTKIIFAQDMENDQNGEFYDLLGGIGAFPYTLVLNEQGVITASFPSSVTYADLEEAVTGSKPILPPEGNRVGNLCYSFEAETVTADGASGEAIDPTKTGKVTVINFWGTWCGPCVAELPYFDKLASEYDVTVIAIHSALSRETAPAFIKTNYPETNMIFAQDNENEMNGEFYDLLGGIGAFPYTVVLDEQGVIIASFPSSVTYEDLEKAICE